MRNDNDAFLEKNYSTFKEPLFYVEIMYDDAYTDPYYFTSNSSVDLPSTATSANTFHDTLEKITSTSQQVNVMRAVSSIGAGECTIIDKDGVLSTLISDKWAADESLRNKRFRTYVGYKGLSNSEYVNVATQIKQDETYDGLAITFKLEDLQRTTKKNVFILNETTLSQSITIDQVAIPVQSASSFELNWHDANYTDLPSQDAGYISIKPENNKEVISWTGKVATAITDTGTDISFTSGDSSVNATSTDLSVFTAGQFLNIDGSTSNDGNYVINTVSSTKLTLYALDGSTAASITTEAAGDTVTVAAPVQFYNCTRGTLNTRPQPYEVDTTVDVDRREKVTEHVYLETESKNIAYGILTGIWFGTANTLPSNWHLGIDTSLVNSSTFTDYGSSRVLRFSGEKKQDGKQFIAEQVNRPFARYLKVLNDGDLAMARITGVLSDASYVKHLTEKDILDFGSIMQDDGEVYNQFDISWNWEDSKGRTTRVNILEDTASQTKHKVGRSRIELEFRGLHGSATTLQDIYAAFNMLRDRHAGPPLKWNLKALHKHNDLEIGDIIRVTLSDVINPITGSTIDRAFEVQGKTVDWFTGDVTLHLFGSTEKAGELSSTLDATVMSDDFYDDNGSLLTANKLDNHLTISANAVTADGSLTGEDAITTNSIYWWDNDLTINTGVTVDWTNNVELRIKGQLTLNGTITGSGEGAAKNTAGALGVTRSGGSLNTDSCGVVTNIAGTQLEADLKSVPYFDVVPDSTGDTLSGSPSDLRGSGSPDGADATGFTSPDSGSFTGADGVKGGGGVVIVCRGISAGVNGEIITSGATGNPGNYYEMPSISICGKNQFTSTKPGYSGASGGGAPGGALILLDGNSATSTLSDSNFTMNRGDIVLYGNPLSTGRIPARNDNYLPDGILEQNTSMWRVQYIPDLTTAVEDAQDTADIVTAITPNETTNSPQTVGQNLSTVQIDVTAPSDSNYAYSNVYYKTSSQTDYTFVGPARDSVNLPPTVMDGTTYDVIAKPVSVKGIESEEFTSTTVTVSTASGFVTMGTDNHVKAGQTAYDTGTGFYLGDDSGTPKFSIGNSAGNKLTWNGSTLAVTGTMTATIGAIGGWTLTATTLTSSNITLDSSNQYIAINNTAWQSAGIQLQYNSGSPRMYVGDGSTKYFQFDGTDVTVGAGTLKETTYEMYTSGLIKTDSAPSTNGGVQIDNGGVKCWDSSGNLNVHIDSANGKLLLDSTEGSLIDLDSSTGAIAINNTTYGSQGIQLQDNSGTPRAYIGDGADKFLEFDGTDINIGRDSKINGTDSYNNSNIYWSGHLQNFELRDLSTGSGTVTQHYDVTQFAATSSGDTAVAYISTSLLAFDLYTWANNRRLKTVVQILNNTAYGTTYVGMGYTSGRRCCFRFDSDGNVYAETHDGTTLNSTSLGTYSTSTNYELEIVFDSGTDAKFYINGTLKSTETSNLPSGTTQANILLFVDNNWVSNTGHDFYVGEFKFEQDE